MEHKSKEEILATKNWNSEYPNYMAEDQILEAMDEWAQQVAISLAEWIAKNVAGNYADGVRFWDLKRSSGHIPLTTQQLFALFLTHQSI